MTIHLVTFSNDDMSKSADLCVESANRHGADRLWDFRPYYLQQSGFYKQNKAILDEPRGCGLWLWKPFLISIVLNNSLDGDLVIYSDAGVEFINNVNYIIDRMDQDIFLFGNQWEHAHWCKRDVIEAVFPSKNPPYMSDKEWSEFGKQVQASVIFFKVTDYSKRFVKEWLDFCLVPGLIDDSPSKTPNHPEFQEHRHDQAILTTLAYREGIKLHWWPASYNDGAFIYERGDYLDEGYPVLFNHHRKRNHEWSVAA